jgi:hypothetical protein
MNISSYQNCLPFYKIHYSTKLTITNSETLQHQILCQTAKTKSLIHQKWIYQLTRRKEIRIKPSLAHLKIAIRGLITGGYWKDI